MNFAQTELLIHVVNRDTNRILDVDRWVGSVLRWLAHLHAQSQGGDPPKEAYNTFRPAVWGSCPEVGRASREEFVGMSRAPSL